MLLAEKSDNHGGYRIGEERQETLREEDEKGSGCGVKFQVTCFALLT